MTDKPPSTAHDAIVDRIQADAAELDAQLEVVAVALQIDAEQIDAELAALNQALQPPAAPYETRAMPTGYQSRRPAP